MCSLITFDRRAESIYRAVSSKNYTYIRQVRNSLLSWIKPIFFMQILIFLTILRCTTILSRTNLMKGPTSKVINWPNHLSLLMLWDSRDAKILQPPTFHLYTIIHCYWFPGWQLYGRKVLFKCLQYWLWLGVVSERLQWPLDSNVTRLQVSNLSMQTQHTRNVCSFMPISFTDRIKPLLNKQRD